MTYLISGHNPRSGLRGSALNGDFFADAMSSVKSAVDTAAKTTKQIQDVISPPPPKPKAAPAPTPLMKPAFRPGLLRLPGATAPAPSFGTQSFGEAPKDNTMLYVGGAAAALAVAYFLMKR